MKKTYLLLAVLAAFTCTGLPALAQEKDAVGLVVAVRGKAEAVDAQGTARRLAMKSPLYRNDTVRTGPHGRVQVIFTDNTIVSLGKASELVIIEHVWNSGSKSGAMKTQVKEGVFRIMGGAIAKEAPRNFTTVTPAATIGIRGSMYAGRVDAGRLTVVFEGGRGIDVTNEAGAVSITRPGFGTSIPAPGAPPQEPKRFSSQDLSDLNQDLAVDGQETGDEEYSPGAEDGQDQQAGEDAGDEGDQESSAEDPQETSGDETDDSTGDGDAQEQESADSQDTGDEPADTGDEAAGTGDEGTNTGAAETGDEAADSGIQTTETADETPDSGDTLAVSTGGEDSTSSGDTAFSMPDSGEALDLASTDLSDGTTLSTSTTLLQTSDSITSTTTTSTTLTNDVTQTWQEPFNDSDTSELPEPPATNIIDLTGFHMSALADSLDDQNTNNSYQYDTEVQATSSDGLVSEDPAAQSNTFSDLSFSMNPYDSEAAYIPPEDTSTLFNRVVYLLGAERTIPMKVTSDPKGEFVIFGAGGSFTQGQTYLYHELGFLGAACGPTLPTDGISDYYGPALGFEELMDPYGHHDFGTANMFTDVNWYNNKVFGRMGFSGMDDPATQDPNLDERKDQLFFIADIDRTNRCLTNVQVFGPRGVDPDETAMEPVAWIEGTGRGMFYGSENQGFGFTGIGDDYDIRTMADIGTSRLVAAGFRHIEPGGVDDTSPRGTRDFYGFLVGVAEDMSAPETNRRIFMNDYADDFHLSLEQDTGTVSGTIVSAADLLSPYENHLDYIEMGSSHGSVYTLEDNFIALLGDTGNDCVTSSTETGGLKPRANYLVTEDPDFQISPYFSWGYWEIAYTDPLSGADYHVHAPGSLWIAGELTPSDALVGLQTSGLVGEYLGGAQGVMFSETSQMSRLHNGSTEILVDFSSSSVSGSIAFDEVLFSVDSGYVFATESAFSANITGTAASGTSTGMARGAFFGPNAEAAGGTFQAVEMSGTRYIGVFGGVR